MGSAKESAISILRFSSPVGYLIYKLVNMTSETEDLSSKEISQLRIDTERKELESRIAESKARVAQELAIANRISTADEVVMEEYYDYSGEGFAGAKIDKSSCQLGVSGSGRKISKRVLHFKGYRADDAVAEYIETPCDPDEK